MKNTLIYLSLIMSVFITSGNAKNFDCNKFIKQKNRSNILRLSFSYGKDAIPCLIETIDENKIIVQGFMDRQSSYLPPLNNYSGIESAYIIEFILAKESVDPNYNFNTSKGENPYRIYHSGLIVKAEEKYPSYKALKYEDMILIKKIYFQWWQKNKSKSIEQLRKDWKENNRPLKNTKYKWI